MTNNTTTARLLAKSQEAFLMAIEIYNKPTVKYRVEGFALFICNAWELMLKAYLITRDGEDSIYFRDNPNRTISLDECAARIFTNSKDPLRKNLKRITTLRNTSTHFITEEHELVYAPLFQACVSNYDDKMFALHKINISDLVPANYLYLSMAPSVLDPDVIRGKYSVEVAERLLRDANEITQEKIIESSQKYSIVVHTEIAVVKNPDKADFTVRYDKDSDIPLRTVNVYKDPSNTHPFSTRKEADPRGKGFSVLPPTPIREPSLIPSQVS
jgi:hypothetical protein